MKYLKTFEELNESYNKPRVVRKDGLLNIKRQ
jgi:hypothetical protein